MIAPQRQAAPRFPPAIPLAAPKIPPHSNPPRSQNRSFTPTSSQSHHAPPHKPRHPRKSSFLAIIIISRRLAAARCRLVKPPWSEQTLRHPVPAPHLAVGELSRHRKCRPGSPRGFRQDGRRPQRDRDQRRAIRRLIRRPAALGKISDATCPSPTLTILP